ncbi:hypothetical protein N7519_007716 [Penicillium mononematosum]|uniref:uncharacterized protein n=1 Tax=Penicillium mononematosum TaxID=268346 RepID=UPI0025468F37|nr:uncharacterized protein N7519_007716 [Penicillium mononematosum]KAJ6186415.1 hypothetical protein N7519_007716 [Penicillium mononematosum]
MFVRAFIRLLIRFSFSFDSSIQYSSIVLIHLRLPDLRLFLRSVSRSAVIRATKSSSHEPSEPWSWLQASRLGHYNTEETTCN